MLSVKTALEFELERVKKGNCKKAMTRTSSTSDHQNVSSGSCNSNGNKGPDLEGILARSWVRPTFTSRVTSSRC